MQGLGGGLDLPKKALRPAFHRAIRLTASLTEHRYSYVLVLAHMRSGSTLLSHIIGSHPQFCYGGETYRNYRTAADLPNLVIEACQRLHKVWLNVTYIVGQINHAIISEETLKSPRIYKCVILIRSPEATIKSRVATPYAPGMPGMAEKEALEYYVKRLSDLVGYARVLKEQALFLEYADLQDHAEETVAALTSFFGVTCPFKTRYEMFRMTGGHGDPSGNIRAGRIIQPKPHEVAISDDSITRASIAYEECRKQLLSSGVRLVSAPSQRRLA
jgi:hypothetical protein